MSTSDSVDAPASEPASIPVQSGTGGTASLTVAIIWALVAVILAAVLLTGAEDQAYGGEAYTGIQNAVMLGVRGIAFLLFGSAALGLVISLRRDRR